MNINQLHKVLPILFKAGITPNIIGHRGLGKSQSIDQYCKKNNLGLVMIRLGQMADAGDLIGLADFLRDEKGNKKATKFIEPIFLPQSGNGILFLDEINRAPKDILQAAFELVYDRSISINQYKIPEGWNLVSAMNPPTDDYDLLDFDDEAFKDRFCHVKFEPTVNDWIDYMVEKHGRNSFTDFIKDQPDILRPKLQDFSLSKFAMPSGRTGEGTIIVEKICKEEGLDEGLTKELIMGLIGPAATNTYFSFKKNSDKSIEGDTILNDYKSIKNIIEKYKNIETRRDDLLKDTCDKVTTKLKEVDSITENQALNLVSFLKDIPKELAYSVCMNFKKNQEYKSLFNIDGDKCIVSSDNKAGKEFINFLKDLNKNLDEIKNKLEKEKEKSSE